MNEEFKDMFDELHELHRKRELHNTTIKKRLRFLLVSLDAMRHINLNQEQMQIVMALNEEASKLSEHVESEVLTTI